MDHRFREMAKTLFRKSFEELSKREQYILEGISERRHITRDTNRLFDDQLTFGQRIADRVADLGGSWTFIFLFIIFLLGWIFLNSFMLVRRAFDPYPYILLNLFLSMLAALQAPIIMMTQNRLAAKDRLDAAHDYEVNLKAELEILSLHQKLDSLRERQWDELLSLQKEQIEMLTRLLGARQAESAQEG